MHRVEHITRSGDFDTESLPELWQGIFELKFAIQWYCKGGERAKLCDAAIHRDKFHHSCFDVELASRMRKLFQDSCVDGELAEELLHSYFGHAIVGASTK